VTATVSGTTPLQLPVGSSDEITTLLPSDRDDAKMGSPNTPRGLSNQLGKYGPTCRLPYHS
jgi:hypothetical protein